jgi:hypothetical protein
MIVKGERDSRVADVGADIFAPRLSDAAARKTIDPLDDDVRVRRSVDPDDANGDALRRPTTEAAPDCIDKPELPTRRRNGRLDEDTHRLLDPALPTRAQRTRDGGHVSRCRDRSGRMRWNPGAREGGAKVYGKEKGKRTAHGGALSVAGIECAH